MMIDELVLMRGSSWAAKPINLISSRQPEAIVHSCISKPKANE